MTYMMISSWQALYLLLVMLMSCQHPSLAATRIGHHSSTTQLDQQHGHASYFTDLPCPNAEDIAPCVCEANENNEMDLTCVGIEDEAQLFDIFHASIPVPHFHKLHLDTGLVETLGGDVFGNCTFERVWTNLGGILKSVDPDTFIKSASTLNYLSLFNNELQSFPFDTLDQYSALEVLDLLGNSISSFPPNIECQTLKDLILSENPFTTLPSGAFDGLPSLEYIDLSDVKVESMPSGLFKNLDKIRILDMQYMDLVHLQSSQLEVTSPSIEFIDLSSNKMASVEVDAFKGVQARWIYLWYDELTVLPEAVWKPLLDDGVHLGLHGNPLTCGCDIAWLVLEPLYHQFVREARCNSGERLIDLDSYFFENNC